MYSKIVEKKSYFSENIGSKFAAGSAMWRQSAIAKPERFAASAMLFLRRSLSKTATRASASSDFVLVPVATEKILSFRIAMSSSVESSNVAKSPCCWAL